MHPIEVRLEAIEDARAAFYWYMDISPELGESFEREFRRVTGLLSDFPERGSPRGQGFRSGPLRGFPYDVIFLVTDVISVIAVSHHNRRPGWWSRRI